MKKNHRIKWLLAWSFKDKPVEEAYWWQIFKSKKDAMQFALSDSKEYRDRRMRNMLLCRVEKVIVDEFE